MSFRVKVTTFVCSHCGQSWPCGAGIAFWDGRCPNPMCQSLMSGATCSHCGLPMTDKELREGFCPHCRTFQTGRGSSHLAVTTPTKVVTCAHCGKPTPEAQDYCPWCGELHLAAAALKLLFMAFPWMLALSLNAYAGPSPAATTLFWGAIVVGVFVLLNMLPWFFNTLVWPVRLAAKGDDAADPAPQLPLPGTEAWHLARLAIICPKGFANSRAFGGTGL